MVINNLFPTPVGSFELGRDLSKLEQKFMFNLETRPNAGNVTSTNNYVLRDNRLSSLRLFLNNSLQEYFQATMSPQDNIKLEITQSWINYTKTGQYHHKHTHPNSVISGVFYIQASKEIDKLFFYNESYQQIKIVPKEFHVYNSESWWLPVETGQLLLFPSSLTHMVATTSGEDDRISMSFNTFYKGKLGDEVALTALTL
tara:strand:- start:20 stop:619 length:600 start_codon:yes stop_codon:yes gene_type:complete